MYNFFESNQKQLTDSNLSVKIIAKSLLIIHEIFCIYYDEALQLSFIGNNKIQDALSSQWIKNTKPFCLWNLAKILSKNFWLI